MTYFDANIFIYSLIYDETLKEVKKAEFYLKNLINGKVKACTSTLTWDEVFYIVGKISGFNGAVKAGNHLLSFPNLKFISIDTDIISKAQKIAEKYRVRPRDAIHATCALKFCNGNIVSNDSDFDDIEGIRRKF